MSEEFFNIEFKKISEEDHESEISFYIGNKNICLFKYENEVKYRTTRWNLDELVLYMRDLYEILVIDDPFPFNINGECAAELDNNARNFDSDDENEFINYYDKLNEWGYKHSWHHACSGAILADVFFRRVKDYVEISWWSEQEDDGIIFKNKYGFLLVPFDTFIKKINESVQSYNDLWL